MTVSCIKDYYTCSGRPLILGCMVLLLLIALLFQVVGVIVVPFLPSLTLVSAAARNSSNSIINTMEKSPTQQQPAFSLFVTFDFVSEEYKQIFIQDITPLIEYIKEYESTTTIGYEILWNDQNPLNALLVERYIDKDNAFLQIHRSSAQFQEFRPKLQKLIQDNRVKMNGQSYYDSNIGYIGVQHIVSAGNKL